MLADSDNAAWYQYTISVQDGKPGLAAAGSSTNFDQEYTAEDPIIGYSVTNGSFSVTTPELTPDDVTLTVDDTVLTPDGDGVYTLQGINEDKVIELEIPVAVIISVNGDTSGKYASLADAVEAYSVGNGYIQLLGDVNEDVNIDTAVRLDLAGFDVNGKVTINGSGTLCGMDIETVTGNVAPVCQSPKAADGTYERYLAIQDENGWSFHRFNISVTGYRFELATSTPECALFFIAQFSGDELVRNQLQKIEITMTEGGNPITGPSIKFADGAENDELLNRTEDGFQFEAYLVRAFSGANDDRYNKHIGAYATVIFKGDGRQESEERELSYSEAWNDALRNDKQLGEAQKEKLKEFLGELKLLDEAE